MALGERGEPAVPGYDVGRLLGSGGMGRVYLARSVSGRRVALKVIRPEFAADPGFRDRFRHETDAARRVSGAFTAAVVDADPDGDPPWMATVYVPGPSLGERLASGPPLTGPELYGLATGLAEALRDIHRAGLIHRDLTPGNILLSDDGPRVIDFGVARASAGQGLTRTGLAVGTPPFMSPEQVRGAVPLEPSSDVFAFGSVMAYAARGVGPFDAADSFATAYRVIHEEPDLSGTPEWLAPLLAECLAKTPAERPTPAALLARLAGISPAGAALAGAAPAPYEPTRVVGPSVGGPGLPEPGPPAAPPPDAVTSAAPAVPPEPAAPTRVDRPVPIRTEPGVPHGSPGEPEERTVRFLDSPPDRRRGPVLLAAAGAVCAAGAAALAVYLGVLHDGSGSPSGGASHSSALTSGGASHSSAPSSGASASRAAASSAPAPNASDRTRPAVSIQVRAASDSSFLEVTSSSGRRLYTGVLDVGDVQSFTDTTKLKLVIGDAGAVDVIVNGHDIGPAGPTGEVVRLVYGPGDPS